MEEQHVRIKAILEIIGKPKDYIESKMKEYIESIKENPNLMLISENVYEPLEKDKIWSIIAEIEVVVKGVDNLVGFCIDYMPSSIDVIKPDHFAFEERIFTGFLNDMLAKLHRVDMIAKQLGGENTFLKKNMNNVIRNTILILLKFGIDDLDKMVKAMGIEKEELKSFLQKLIEEQRITEEKDIYRLKK